MAHEHMAQDRHWYQVSGGVPLTGTVTAAGAKNSVTKLLVASLLTDRPCTLDLVPDILEVHLVLDMLAELGTKVSWTGPGQVTVHTPTVTATALSEAYSGVNRIPVLMIGPLLHRVGEAYLPLPGGCTIGKRPIDYHLSGLAEMGAAITEELRSVKVHAGRLNGVHFTLPFPSVGATESLLLAGVLAKGTTVIQGAAVEPEVIDLVMFLQKMGALVNVETDRTITIEGVEKLRGAEHSVIPDRIETASFAALAVATGGRIEVAGAQQEHLVTFLNAMRKVGGEFAPTDGGLVFWRERPLTAVHQETGVHPGFMTDWQQPFTVMLTQAKGTSIMHETIYEDRFGYTQQLAEMGADISLSDSCLGSGGCRWHRRGFQHTAIVTGPVALNGAHLAIPDLRAGFSYIMAALIADGTSTVAGTRYLERGYEDPVGKLRAVGAHIETITAQ
ncbi:UDP-N-acetylglucosamine 1-carboxyvinyltransferase [Kitasatospora sp. NBC_01287]|uniref:UDP-N-acetylglucosamine 1-carboxyvinyltransferase n=1 Tax=Kitasatospora sp. NBC_01287 TaxID=2903573 RepID=UPI002256F62E|nr:UDP-N-acetylglucosamine 1-carboxyvinyltransferase [Kitasatospora sp. NBC_01287]MCX4745976.1 UDP-N-acetylglucosamine 1-carboxyvinyltransferase [Kitasatospora sp. NBC_01287]